ncbi:hypothetical protein GOFOIKOB_6584 [Methylobacterium tardum]|uniref:Uncharacterized protein n=1 Tax=Methylobacterium tardum TaxID=374432 RepID=A0AA37TG34_9HYPH|nr:hypothetical protein [Methylobacterium tardum]URD37893.1 hypothetical protein M6G65_05100 [Methylobacterium tardum]GJE53503.1 hypothetical protein GOFOIKOB_6584 [Methylobacterium tardum]GLS68088.1 hypothetical protein GCM10007890_00990 [Methylobacterium tardum]
MKGLLLNALLGLGLGRFGSVWWLLMFLPIVAVELAYGVSVYHLNMHACIRRGAALLVCGELAFLLGALMRPLRGET